MQVNSAAPDQLPGNSRDFEDFIYIVSHDVRNSVRALIEVPQWIGEDLRDMGVPIRGALSENLEMMNTHTKRLDRMLMDLLVFSRIGRMQSVVEVNLAEAMENLCQEIRWPSRIRLDLALQQKTLRIGEQDRMTLLTALLSNSLRHSDAQTSLIRFASWREGDETVLSFVDDGPGIAPRYRERVFGAMTTLKSRDEVEGSGMGLAHVRKIISHYGATLRWIELPSERGVGFEMRFPV
ncbi:MAG: HAMP domain-containing sensor histidine kinase [Cypionkella sp.]